MEIFKLCKPLGQIEDPKVVILDEIIDLMIICETNDFEAPHSWQDTRLQAYLKQKNAISPYHLQFEDLVAVSQKLKLRIDEEQQAERLTNTILTNTLKIPRAA